MFGFSLRRGLAPVFVACVLIALLAGCQGPTTVTLGDQPQGYKVSLTTDPITLNPPQLSTLTYRVTDTKTGKPVTSFAPVSDALLHNVLIHRDLQYFKHSYTRNIVDEQASVQTYFPRTGTYVSYSIYQPEGAPTQVFSTTIVSGEATGPVTLAEDSEPIPARVSRGVRVQLVKPSGGYKAGQESQIVFHVSERGVPVTALWPLLGAPGHLWLVNEDATEFTHLTGEAAARRFEQPTETGSPSSPTRTASAPTGTPPAASGGTGANLAATGVPGQQMGTVITPSPPPTLRPEVAQSLATVTAAPQPTLFPVQQTALSSILETPEVQTSLGFGPEVIFTHTFPAEGMYKMWLELYYRGEVFTTDFAVRVTR